MNKLVPNNTCYNMSTDWASEWNSSSPDIPTCFQFFDAPLYLLGYLILCFPYIIHLIRKKVNKRPILKLTIIKLAIIVCLMILQILELIYNAAKKNNIPYAYTISNCSFLVCMTILTIMVGLERRCNAVNSGFYFNYWLLHFILCGVRARASGLGLKQKITTRDYSRECFIFINLTFVTLSLVLSCFSEKLSPREIRRLTLKRKFPNVLHVNADDNHVSEKLEMSPNIVDNNGATEKDILINKTDENVDLKECPEYYSSFLSRIIFFWFTPLIVKGYKMPLKNDDLWVLNTEERCSSIVPILLRNFDKCLAPSVHRDNKSDKMLNNDKNTSHKKSKEIEEQEKEKLTSPDDNNKGNIPLNAENDTNKKKEKFDPCLMNALIKSHFPYLLLSGLYKIIHDILAFLGPILLKLLLQFVSDSEDRNYWKGYFIAALMMISAMVRTFILHQYFHIVFKIGMRVRSSLISAVYRKSLRLSTASRKESTVGEIVNLMSIDAQKFLELISYIHMLWSGPFQIIAALVLLWYELGPSVLAGLVIMLLMIPVNAIIGNITRKIQSQQIKVTDSRIKMMNEILNGIKVLKLYAWELSFINFVTEIRNKELKFMKRAAYYNAAISFTFNCAPFLVSLTTFGMFVMLSRDNVLDAEKAFVSITLFNILRFPLMMLPMVISNLIQASVSLKRLTTFLRREEINKDAVSHDDTPGIAAIISDGIFRWDSTAPEPTLKNINITFPEGHLVAIVGPVGCGKSSILSALLGEIDKSEGYVNMKGSIAYVPQQPWIINATIRDNIIFGLPYDACKYQRIIKACCLERDFEILNDADFTEIGEKGINLSGGQKQRVSLARACYSDSNVYLLDDPLSAVDSHVGKDLIDNVISSTGILNGSTRILVTHNLAVLSKCDRIIVMNNGMVSEEGTYLDLIKHAGAFANFITTHLADELQATNNQNLSLDELAEKDMLLQDLQRTYSEINQSNANIISSLSKSREQIYKSMENLKMDLEKDVANITKLEDEKRCQEELDKFLKPGAQKIGNKLIEEETSKEGNVKMAVYLAYLRSIGFWLAGGIILLFVITQGFSLGSNLWLVRWSDQSKIAANLSKELKELISQNSSQTQIDYLKKIIRDQRDLNLGIYGVFGFCQALIQLFSSIFFAFAIIQSAASLHKLLLNGVLRCPMNMFETVPVGRIINRFSSDLNAVGTMLPHFINGFLITTLQALVVFIMVTIPNPWIIIPLSLMIAFYILIQRVYVATSRQLKRLESVVKSPIYSHFGETLQGVSSIRAYALCDKFIESNDNKVDRNLYSYYANIVSNRWLAVILETVGNSIVFMAALFAVISLQNGTGINAGLVGLSVSYALSITQTLNWLVRMSSEVESNIVAVERIEEYSQMPPEAPWDISEKKPDEKWPTGCIKFVNYSTKYREGLDNVLKNISFMINPREKVGIVGRTGSGKSSLVLALFRILEKTDGEILIDGVPIHELGLHDVRGRLTIIPQDPVLFSGTLRRNLDPFNKHGDEEIWKVLEMSNLKPFVVNSGNEQLEMVISEGGENLSVGQRQLVCLARALLRRTNILVLDEATAAVDLDTDVLIQETIRREFKECTILTIAHRLNTVLDYDQILVLENGEIIEMDTPNNLLKNPESQFYSMAKSSNLI